MTDDRPNDKPKSLVSVEWQREVDLATGKGETRMFVKMYFEARDSGLLRALGDRRWRTLSVLATYMDQNGHCYPSQATIAKDLGIHRQRVNERIQELLTFRFNGQPVVSLDHVAQTRDDRGRWHRNVYRIHPIAGFRIFNAPKTPDEATAFAASGKPDTAHSASTVSGFTDTVDPDTNKNQLRNQIHTSVSDPSKITIQAPYRAADLVAHFHRAANHDDNQAATPKELKQAKAILGDHGLDKARFIVSYAVNYARDRFGSPPETFGGVLHVIPAALVAYAAQEARRQDDEAKQRQQRENEAALATEREAWIRLSPKERLERRLDTYPKSLLTPERLEELKRRYAEEEGYQPSA